MANEITGKVYLAVNKSAVPELTKAPAQFQVTMTGTDLIYGSQIIGTSAENINKGEVTTPGMSLFHNLDSTNYIEIGHDETGSFVADIKVKAGEWCLVRLNQTTPQAKATGGNVAVEYLIIED